MQWLFASEAWSFSERCDRADSSVDLHDRRSDSLHGRATAGLWGCCKYNCNIHNFPNVDSGLKSFMIIIGILTKSYHYLLLQTPYPTSLIRIWFRRVKFKRLSHILFIPKILKWPLFIVIFNEPLRHSQPTPNWEQGSSNYWVAFSERYC